MRQAAREAQVRVDVLLEDEADAGGHQERQPHRDSEGEDVAMGISLGDVLAFALTVWLAFLVSTGIRFVLQEDVYPHLRLARARPHMLSSPLPCVHISP